jgi:hypothetical protein
LIAATPGVLGPGGKFSSGGASRRPVGRDDAEDGFGH